MPNECHGETIKVINSLSDRSEIAKLLVSMVTEGSSPLVEKALEAVKHIESEYSLANSLSELAPYLPPDLTDEVLNQVIPTIRSESCRALALTGFLESIELNEYTLWKQFLHTLSSRGRKDFITALPKFIHGISRFTQCNEPEAVMDVVQIIDEVYEQWP